MWNNSSGSTDPGSVTTTGSVVWALQVILAIVMALIIFSLGCSVEIKKVWLHMKHPWGILVGMLCQFVMMPFTAYVLALLFNVSSVEAIAVIVVGSCPGGSISNFITYWLDGDMDLSITMTSVSTMLGLGTMPLNLYLYSHAWVEEGQIQIPYLTMGIASLSLIVPVTFGVLLNYKWPKVARILLKVGSVGGGLVMLVVGIATIVLYDGAWSMGTSILLIGALFPVIGCLTGFIIAIVVRQPLYRCRTIAMETGAQNMQIGGTVLQLFFPAQQLSQVIMLPLVYASFQMLTGFLLIVAFQFYKRTSFTKCVVTDAEKNQFETSLKGEINTAFENDCNSKVAPKEH